MNNLNNDERYGKKEVKGEVFTNEAQITGIVPVLETLIKYGAAFILTVGTPEDPTSGNFMIEDFRKEVDANDRTRFLIQRAYIWRVSNDGFKKLEVNAAKVTPVSAGTEAKRGSFYALNVEEGAKLGQMNRDGIGEFHFEVKSAVPVQSLRASGLSN